MDMEQAIQVARALLEGESAVVPDRARQRLLVHATEEEHRRLSEAFAAVGRPAPNVRIDVDWEEVSSERERGIRAGLVADPGGVRMSGDVRHRDSRADRRTRQTLVMASGREALLKVGEQVPWLEWIEDWAWRAGILQTRVQWQEVGAFLAVEATVIGEGPYVRIRVTPELSGRVEGQPHRIRFAQVATEITAKSGERVPLAGLGEHRDFYDRFLVGLDRNHVRRSLRATLTPTILPVGASGPPAEPTP